MSAQASCAICGRTFLVGEQPRPYVSPDDRYEVCELCAARAEERGWLPADEAGAAAEARSAPARRPGILARLFGGRRGGGDEQVEEPAEPDAPGPAPAPEAPGPTPEAKSATEARLPDPADRGMRPRRAAPDLSPQTRFERAIARFTASDAGRTVAGLTRTLGSPSASVGDLAGEDDVVRITVAWELTWYQWGVDLGDELRPVFELARGFEMDDIDAAARQWNAAAQDGRIVLVAPRRAAVVEDRPARR